MSRAFEKWRERLEYLQQQEGILSDPAQKFTVAEQIKEAKARIVELESPLLRRLPWRKLASVAVVLLLLSVLGIALFKYLTAPKIITVTAGAGFSVFAKPEQDSQIISRVSAGQKFELVEPVVGSGKRIHNWAVVRYGGREGWVMAQDMSVVTPINRERAWVSRSISADILHCAPAERRPTK